MNTSPDQKRINALTLAAIGVVFGDIGTSPLYALKEAFAANHGIPFSVEGVFGIISMLFWSMIIVVSLKYVLFVMRADNNGEGGILSLMALALRCEKQAEAGQYTSRTKWIFLAGIFGACLFYGDAIITPAISVLSAVEGIGYVAPQLSQFILPITLLILIILFAIQSKGTHVMGKLFGPITLLWFLSLGVLGVYHIFDYPKLLMAINPYYAIDFFIQHTTQAFVVLGSVFLVLTGAEALYADMGHFGIKPIRRGWFYVVMPCLLLHYFGQGAFLIAYPEAIKNPFYLMVPESLRLFILFLATSATVIASQAVISGAFSLTAQAIQLGYLPRMSIKHTSSQEIGQIYIPAINWMLLFLVIVVVLMFKESSNLAAAYGIAVTGTMVVTTLLAWVVMRRIWKWNPIAVNLLIGLFLVIDLAFFGANAIKIKEGGWLPLMVAFGLSFIILTWYYGKQLLRQRTLDDGIALKTFLPALTQNPPHRVAGHAIFLCADIENTPVALLHNLKHNKVLHQNTLFIHLKTLDIPKVDTKDRLEMEDFGHGLYAITASFGFMETPNLLDLLPPISEKLGLDLNLMETSFFVARESVVPSKLVGMPIWREALFAWMHKNAAKPSDFFQIPTNRVVELGTKIEI
jgi:KUP system potassium uptake protein